MSDPEQQDGEDEAQDDGEAAAAEAGACRVRIPQLLPRGNDPLGPLRTQLAGTGRIVNQLLIDTMASIRAQQNAQIVAAVNAVVKPRLNIIDPALIASIVWLPGLSGSLRGGGGGGGKRPPAEVGLLFGGWGRDPGEGT
ncbi:hypothetical protein ACFQ6N_35380, partial [Kitasatospora sp. NPDC056446]|uniref:hypothetical protein n=1 Tax=Kitasatospora sp. NPDC056446 TaxID=3345819 RepID=UPI0036C20855